MSNIVLLATFWNEKYWVEDSLKQIKKINPRKVIICDGCFDHKFPLHSTDGTYEIIKEFAKKNSNVTVVSPIRLKKSLDFQFIKHVWSLYFRKKITLSTPSMLKRLIKSNYYRVNQALTFSMMLNMTDIEENEWFMTFDADQFYDDTFYDYLRNINDLNENIMSFRAKEFTFISDYSTYTDEKGPKSGNNLPYRFNKNTVILPTRNVHLQGKVRATPYEEYESFSVGCYYHYKINNTDRTELTYKVGDREPPSYNGMTMKQFLGEHPELINNRITKSK